MKAQKTMKTAIVETAAWKMEEGDVIIRDGAMLQIYSIEKVYPGYIRFEFKQAGWTTVVSLLPGEPILKVVIK